MNRFPRIRMACTAMIVVFVFAMIHPPMAVGQQADKATVPTDSEAKKAIDTSKSSDKPSKTPWVSLTGRWKACEFGGEGDVTIKGDVIKMEYGDPITGVRWEGPFDGDKAESDGDKSKSDKSLSAAKPKVQSLPRDNYEIRWDCRRDRGHDFMCAFTFPVADKYASLVMGGWGGGITGISSIDGQDASDNDTTMFLAFDNDKWYGARVRVDQEEITVWVDGTELFAHPRKDYDFDIRFEMDPCTPMGIANFECDSQFRNIQIRRLHTSEIPSTENSDN